MLFLISLLISGIFIYFCRDFFKKKSVFFYELAIVVTVSSSFVDTSFLPKWINEYVISLVTKGTLGTAFFVYVMYAGALKRGSKIGPPLMKIRGELSIFAAFLVLSHNITYGKVYFKILFTNAGVLKNTQLIAAIISVAMIFIMIVLTITSFMSIRKKMNHKNWKRLQRTAYAFYGLMYVHIMLINIPYARMGKSGYLLNVIVYSVVFVSYGVLRVRKFYITKITKTKTECSRNVRVSNVIGVATIIVVCFLTVSLSVFGRNVNDNESENKRGNGINFVASDDNMSVVEDNNTDDLLMQGNEISTALDTAFSGEKEIEKEDSTTISSVDDEVENITKSDGKKSESESESIEETNKNNENSSGENGNEKVTESESKNNEVKETTNKNNNETKNQVATKEGNDSKEQVTTVHVYTYKNGTYEGTANVSDDLQFDYEILVTVKINNDKLTVTGLNANGANDDDWEFIERASILVNSINLSGSVDGVDVISGATYSSKGIIEAVKKAQNKAK